MFPHLVTATNVPRLTKVGDVDWGSIDAAFCCLPHATTQEILNSLPKHIKVVDLSADFRLKDTKLYAEWCALTTYSWTHFLSPAHSCAQGPSQITSTSQARAPKGMAKRQ